MRPRSSLTNIAATLGHARRSPRNFVPSSADFLHAGELTLGQGLLPEAHAIGALRAGRLAALLELRLSAAP